MELPETGGLYGTGNVTYRGVEVGRVQSVGLTDTGVEAVLSLKSGIDIPSDLKAEVHSQSAIGEQYVDLLPRNGGLSAAQGRRRDPALRHLGAAGHQHAARRDQHRPAGDSARQPEDGDRRGLHRRRRPRPAAVRDRQGLNDSGHRCTQESRSAHQPDRQLEAGAGFPDPVPRRPSRPGRRIWPR